MATKSKFVWKPKHKAIKKPDHTKLALDKIKAAANPLGRTRSR